MTTMAEAKRLSFLSVYCIDIIIIWMMNWSKRSEDSSRSNFSQSELVLFKQQHLLQVVTPYNVLDPYAFVLVGK